MSISGIGQIPATGIIDANILNIHFGEAQYISAKKYTVLLFIPVI
jgi:hypothetical protein